MTTHKVTIVGIVVWTMTVTLGGLVVYTVTETGWFHDVDSDTDWLAG